MNLDELRTLCSTLPGTTEDVKWGDDLCFCVGKKMYVVTGLETPEITVKLPDDDAFAEWTSRPGIEPAPYVGRFKWITIREGAAIDTAEVEELVRQSYALIRKKLPKAVRDGLD